MARFFYYNLVLIRMPKKTKQYGWQCSECDKEPDMHPNSFTPQIDLEAPRSSRNRGPPKALSLLCMIILLTFKLLSQFFILGDSDLESSVNRDSSDADYSLELSQKQNRKSLNTDNVGSDVSDDKIVQTTIENNEAVKIPAIKNVPVNINRKRGRSSLTSEKSENQENVSPPVKSRRGRKPKSTSPSQLSSTLSTVTVIEPIDSVVPQTDVASSDGQKSPTQPELPQNLPPKKLFKSKATLKEVSSQPNDSTNFKNWLDAKLSPTKPVSDSNLAHVPILNGIISGKQHFNEDLTVTPETPEASPTSVNVCLGKCLHEILDINRIDSVYKRRPTRSSRVSGSN